MASVVNTIADGRAEVWLEDLGYAFAVHCRPALSPDWVAECPFFVGAPFLMTLDKKSGTKVIKGASLDLSDLPQSESDILVDYEVEKEHRAQFFTQRAALSDEARQALARGQDHPELRGLTHPHPHWDLFRAINPNALQSYNSLMGEWWRRREAFPELLAALLQLTATTPNDEAGARAALAALDKRHGWERAAEATAVQLFNPSQGKGSSNPKAVWSSPNNLSGFWLTEWLKAVGFFHGGMTRNPAGSKDRKSYVLIPHNLEWGTHRAVLHDFQASVTRSETALKLDIYAVLRYTSALLQHFEAARVEEFAAELFGRRAADLVSGLQTAFYKDLGNSTVVMNMATLQLPRWVRVDSRAYLPHLQTALDEHQVIIRGLDEKRGDQFALLSHYRDFLSSGDLRAFFDFTTAYSGFLISQMERRAYVRPFTVTTLEVLFMNSNDADGKYAAIISNEGFRNVAYAIRHSTIVPQGHKARGVKPAVQVRYGLGQQLTRKSAYPDEFLAELSEFLFLYNAENEQLRENERNPFRKNVRTADIEAIAELIDHFGSKVVCAMLVAYGYAREPREADPTDPNPPPTEEPDESDESDD